MADIVSNGEQLLPIRQLLNVTLQPFSDLSSFTSTSIPSTVNLCHMLTGSQVQQLIRDPAGSITSADGAKWSSYTIADLTSAQALAGKTIDNSPIGQTTPAAGKFTSLQVTGAATLAAIDGTPIGQTTPAAGKFTSLQVTGAATLAAIDGTPIGQTTPAAVKATTLQAASMDSTPIGQTTPAAVKATTLQATTSLTAPSLNGGQFGGMRNVFDNPNFLVNQRGVSGTVVLAAGAYGHDRWKAGAAGCTYTATTINNLTTINITAGSLMQVIPGNRLQTGNYQVSWSGTAQGKVSGGTYAASPFTAAATGSVQLTIEFGTGTLIVPQCELGTLATSPEYRPYGLDLMLCMRYYQLCGGGAAGSADSATQVAFAAPFAVPMAAAPVLTLLSQTTVRSAGTDKTSSGGTLAFQTTSFSGWMVGLSGFSGLTLGQSTPQRNGTNFLAASCDL